MKRLITILFVCFIASAQAQYKETRQLGAHNRISVATGINVEYINSNRNEIVVDCEKQEYLDLLLTEVKQGTLEIKYKSNSSVRTKKANTVTVYSSETLDNVKVSSSGQLTLKDDINTSSIQLIAASSGKLITKQIKASKIKIIVNSSGKIETAINTKNLDIIASSSGKATVSGTATKTSVEMSSSANIDLDKLKINELDINGSSSAKLSFNTASTFSASLSSSSKVYYSKVPERIVKNKTSSGGGLQQN